MTNGGISVKKITKIDPYTGLYHERALNGPPSAKTHTMKAKVAIVTWVYGFVRPFTSVKRQV